MAKNLFIKTYGCQMNVYDSDRMADVLAPLGYTTVDGIDNADMVLINTCHIREKASEKVFSALGRLKAWKNKQQSLGKNAKIAVAGCVAQAEGAELSRRAPWVDIVVGPGAYHRLPELIARADPEARTAVIDTDFPIEDKFDFLPEESAPRGAAAFLSIQEGCDKFCSFCVVPYTRGAEFSRPAKKIIAEAKRLIAQGTVDLTLLGQNVNAWCGEGLDGTRWNFAQLLYALADINGLERLRYTTSHPADMNDDLITAHRDLPQLMPYLHLPVQSGSDRILAAMNRRHTADDYRRIIDKLRASRPDIALSSDFIVGFPGESDTDFAETIGLIAEIGYASGYSFKYSPRPGTPAAVMALAVDEAVKAERLESLQQLLAAQQLAFNKEKLGCIMDILVEKPAKHKGQSTGRSPFMQSVHFPEQSAPIGTIIPIEITHAHQHSLGGIVAENRGASTP